MADTDTTEGTEAQAAEGTEEKNDDASTTATEQTQTDPAADAAKWKALARKHEAQAKANATAAKRLQEIEDANKSETEKLTEAHRTAEQRATAAEAKAARYEVAIEKGVPPKLLKFLTGENREEIEAAADELLEAIAADTADANGRNGKPKERLRPGVATDTEPEVTDPRALAAKIQRSSW